MTEIPVIVATCSASLNATPPSYPARRAAEQTLHLPARNRLINRPSRPLVLVRLRAQGHHGPGEVSSTPVPPRSINRVVIISRCSQRGWSVRATGGDRPVSRGANTANNVDRIPMKTFVLTVGIWGGRILYRCCCLRARKPG